MPKGEIVSMNADGIFHAQYFEQDTHTHIHYSILIFETFKEFISNHLQVIATNFQIHWIIFKETFEVKCILNMVICLQILQITIEYLQKITIT